MRRKRAAVQVRLHGSAPARVKKGHEQCQTSLRWHYPDQVVRVFLSLHKEGHPESSSPTVLSGVSLLSILSVPDNVNLQSAADDNFSVIR